jgi:hypothetical protein
MATHGPLFLRGAARMLQNITDEQEQDLEAMASPSSSIRTDGDYVHVLAPVIVGLIVLASIGCIYLMFRVWILRICCGRETSTNDNPAIIMPEGRIFDLNPRQRRAVLEAIFSETSKVC